MPVIENFNNNEIKKLDNTKGHIIYNTTENIVQVNDGKSFVNINTHIKLPDIPDKTNNQEIFNSILTQLDKHSNLINNNYELLSNNKINGTILTSDQPYINKLGKINNLITDTIKGELLTSKQPNITLIGDLQELTIKKRLNVKELDTIITNPIQTNITQLGTLENLDIMNKLNINNDLLNNYQVNINNNQGKCIRLLYNNDQMTDLDVDMSGNLLLNPSGKYIKSNKTIQINNDFIGIHHKSSNNTEFVTLINNNKDVSIGSLSNHPLNLITNNKSKIYIDTNGNVGINTTEVNKTLNINGGSLSLIKDDIITDYEINNNGEVVFNINKGKSRKYIFNNGNIHATIATSNQPYITSIGSLTELNMNGPITGITNISSDTLEGKLLTEYQPNIKKVGILKDLRIESETTMSYTSNNTSQLALFKNTIKGHSSYIEIQNENKTQMILGVDGKNLNNKDTNSVLLSCWSKGDLRFSTNKQDRMRITSDGLIGINTRTPTSQLTINNKNGECLKLECDNINNSNTNVKFNVDPKGKLIINANGSNPSFEFNGGELIATLSKSDQPNITSIGKLTHLELEGDLIGVKEMKAEKITGMIHTSSQPNITSIGKLNNLELLGKLSINMSSLTGDIASFYNEKYKNGTYIELLDKMNNKAKFGIDENGDVVMGNYNKGNLRLINDSTEYMRILQSGKIGMNTKHTERQLNINNNKGECLRLLNNDNVYLDINVLSNGNTEFKSTGSQMNITNNLLLGEKDNEEKRIEFNNKYNKYDNTYISNKIYNKNDNKELLFYNGIKNQIRFRTNNYIFQTIKNDTDTINNDVLTINNNGNMSMNTEIQTHQLNMKSENGKCINMLYEKNNSDIIIDKKGNTIFDTTNIFKFNKPLEATLITPDQTNITRVGILKNLKVDGELEVNKLIIEDLNCIISKEDQPNIKSLGVLNELKINGNMNMDTLDETHKLNINSTTGNHIRLLYNNTINKTDIQSDMKGNLNILPSGKYINTTKQFQITKSDIGYRQISDNNIEFITSINNNSGVSIGSYSNDSVNIITNNMSRMVINTQGNIGINTSNPNSRLDLGSEASNSLLYLYSTPSNIYGFGVLRNTLLYQARNHAWYVNSSKHNEGNEIMKLDGETGYLGINISKALYPLHINNYEKGLGHSMDKISYNTYINKEKECVGLMTTTEHPILFGCNNKSDLMKLSTNGNLGIGTINPNGRLHIKCNKLDMLILENEYETNMKFLTRNTEWYLGTKNNNFYLSDKNNKLLNVLSNSYIGVNTEYPNKQFTINSNTGECLRLINNNNEGTENIYFDINISKNNDINFITNDNNSKFNFNGEINGTLHTSKQLNITQLGQLKELNVLGDIECKSKIKVNEIYGNIIKKEQLNITKLGELSELKVNKIINNYNTGGIVIRKYNTIDVSGKLENEIIIESLNMINCKLQLNNSIEIIGYIKSDYTENYSFIINTDNNIKVWLDNELMNLTKSQDNKLLFSKQLNKDVWYPLYIQYYKINSNNICSISWQSISQNKEIINNKNLAWDNQNNNISRVPLNIKSHINIYNNNHIGKIEIDNDNNMNFYNNNNIFNFNGDVSATIITKDQPYITSIGKLDNLEINNDIKSVNNIYSNNLHGIIQTKEQPNINVIGDLKKLNVAGDIKMVKTIFAQRVTGTILTQHQPNITSIGKLKKLELDGDLLGIKRLKAKTILGEILTEEQPNIKLIGKLNKLEVDGKVEMNELEINCKDNNSLKLYYNKESNNSEINSTLDLDEKGNLNIKTSGKFLNTYSSLKINKNDYGLLHTSSKGIIVYTKINSDKDSHIGNMTEHPLHLTTCQIPRLTINTDGKININTTISNSQLNINNTNGECLRMIYNNENVYTDLNVDANGTLNINSSGDMIYTTSKLCIQPLLNKGLSILSPNGLTEYITSINNDNVLIGTNTNSNMNFITNNKNRIHINNQGHITMLDKLYNISDKKDISEIENINNKKCKLFIKNINSKKYKNNTSQEYSYGFIAQDLIDNGFDELTNVIIDDNKIIKTVNMTEVIPILTTNIKMLYEENKELKERLERLEKLVLNKK